MEIWLRALRFTWASVGRRINKYCGSGRGEKGHCYSEHVSRCADSYRPCSWKYGSVLGCGCVSRCTLVSRCLASIWRIVMFLACDVTADGCCELAPKEDNVHLGPWITEYNLGGWNIVHTARMQSKGWQKGTIQRWETWEWGAGIWTRPTDAWPRIGLPAQKDMIFAGKSKSGR